MNKQDKPDAADSDQVTHWAAIWLCRVAMYEHIPVHILGRKQFVSKEHVRCGGNGIASIRRDADKRGSELIVVDVVEDGSLIGLGVKPVHIIQLACQHQVVMLRSHCFCILPCCVPVPGDTGLAIHINHCTITG